MAKISYGQIAVALFFLYLGLSFAFSSTGIITDLLLLFAGLLTVIGVWTIIYGLLFGDDLAFWLSNGALITLISAAFFTYKYTLNIGISIAVIMIGIGIMIIAFMVRKR